jgi:hypothetical protein
VVDQFSQNEGASSLYRRRRTVKLFGFRLGPRRQVTYAAITIILSIFVNFVFLWPVSHFWALMLIALAISSVVLSDVKRRTAIIGVVAAFAVAGALFGIIGPAPALDGINRQWIVPMAEPTPANICTTQNPELPPGSKLVLIGDSGVIVHAGEKTPLLSVGGCKSAALFQNRSGVLVNADVHDDEGVQLFSIASNQLQLAEGNPVYQERSQNRGAASIDNEGGNELLHIEYLNPRTLRLRGVFACLGHKAAHIQDGKPIPGMKAPVCQDSKPILVP